MKMLKLWVIWLVVAGIAYVSAEECDAENGRVCYETLVHYETLSFPLYGHDEVSLDDTCAQINSSLKCVHAYENCLTERLEVKECDGNCSEVLKLISSFLRRSGFLSLENELCLKGSALRQTYLENVECLVENADKYAACHNESQTSQHYMQTTPGAFTIEANCCYLSWYRDCFTNVTRDNCGLNATFYVSMANHLILGQIADQLCGDTHIFCDKPPMPHDMDDDNEITDVDKPDKTDIDVDNNVDGEKQNSAVAINSYVANVFALLHVFIVCKYML